MFAKIFGPDDGQILVVVCETDTGPEVRFSTQPDGFNVCSIATKYEDTDKGVEDARTFFRKVNNAVAQRFAEAIDESLSSVD